MAAFALVTFAVAEDIRIGERGLSRVWRLSTSRFDDLDCFEQPDRYFLVGRIVRQLAILAQALRIRDRAIGRAGELLKQIEPATGAHRESAATDTLSRKDAAEQAGMSKRQAVTAVRVADVHVEDFEKQVEKTIEAVKVVTSARATMSRFMSRGEHLVSEISVIR